MQEDVVGPVTASARSTEGSRAGSREKRASPSGVVLAERDEDERLDPQTDLLVVDGGVHPGEHAVLGDH